MGARGLDRSRWEGRFLACDARLGYSDGEPVMRGGLVFNLEFFPKNTKTCVSESQEIRRHATLRGRVVIAMVVGNTRSIVYPCSKSWQWWEPMMSIQR